MKDRKAQKKFNKKTYEALIHLSSEIKKIPTIITNVTGPIHIDTGQKQVVTNKIDIKVDLTKDKESLTELLKQLEGRLGEHPEIRQVIHQMRKDIPSLETDPSVGNRLMKLVRDIGDKESPLNQILSSIGIAHSFIGQVVEMGKKLLGLAGIFF